MSVSWRTRGKGGRGDAALRRGLAAGFPPSWLWIHALRGVIYPLLLSCACKAADNTDQLF